MLSLHNGVTKLVNSNGYYNDGHFEFQLGAYYVTDKMTASKDNL